MDLMCYLFTFYYIKNVINIIWLKIHRKYGNIKND